MPQIIFIEKSIVIKATPARLFKALTQATDLMRWAYDRVESDPRMGGQVLIAYDAHEKRGEYRRFIPNLEVAISWKTDEGAFPEDLTVYRLEKLKPGKGIRVRAVDFGTPEEVEFLDTLWTQRLKKLKKLYQSKPAAQKSAVKKPTPAKRKPAARAKTGKRMVQSKRSRI